MFTNVTQDYRTCNNNSIVKDTLFVIRIGPSCESANISAKNSTNYIIRPTRTPPLPLKKIKNIKPDLDD